MIFTRSILNHVLSLENVTSTMLYDALNRIGLEVESYREVIAPKRVVVGKILTCQKHPDATKLNCVEVAIGGVEGHYETLQIVCGASNAREGIYVAVALEGAKLPELTIKRAVLRGVESCGMLCSTTELGFPKIHNGIIELDESIGELILGKELSDYAVFHDEVYEISITPNRGDCMSVLGIARELSVAFELGLKALNPPKVSDNALGIGRVLQIIASDKHDASLLFRAIETKPSTLPLFVNLFLAHNAILENVWLKDAVSFSMFFSGVILNVYPQSFCQIDGQKVILTLKRDELGLESIYHKDKKLSVIGVNPCVYASREFLTKEKEFIVLEASYIPPEIIAQKVMETKVQVDAKIFQRAARGSSPDLKMGIAVLSDLLLGGDGVLYTDAQELIEIQPKHPITIDFGLIKSIIGVCLEKLQVVNILKRLGFEVEIASDENFLIVKPPLFRHDIVGFQDVAEEIIRFYGIDNVPSLPLSFIQKHQTNAASRMYYFRRKVAQKAIGVGFNEAVHFVFDSREKLQHYGFEVLEEDLDLLNPITQDLNTLRSTLLLGLLRAVERNCNNGRNAVNLFEMGAVYDKKRHQTFHLAFVQSGLLCEERYPNAKGIKGDFFGFCDRIMRVVGEFSLQALENPLMLFHSGQSASVIQNGRAIGVIAALHPQVAIEFGLGETYLCELNLELLQESIPQVQMYSKFQKTQRDFSLVLDKGIPYYQIKASIENLKIPSIVEFYPIDVYRDSTLQDKKSLTIRFSLQSAVKTLEEKDINAVMENVLEKLKEDFGVELR